MTAISKAFVDAADTAVDPDSPIDTVLITGFRDSLRHLREWLGASYYAGAAQDHNHDGTNSAAVQIGANYLRNGSFENGVAGWAQTNYTGGTQAIDTAHAVDGINCLAITSTVLANGGGYAQTTEYEPVTAGRSYFFRGNVHASAVNISSKVEVIWFDSTETQISISAAYSSAATPTAAADFSASIIAPTNAKYKQLRVTGGVPATGSAVGTIYFDGFVASQIPNYVVSIENLQQSVGATNFVIPAVDPIQGNVSTVSTSPVKVREWKVWRDGTYTIRQYTASANGAYCYIQVYKNGVAVGTLHASNAASASFDDTISATAGDLIQVYIYTGSVSISVSGSGALGETSPFFNYRTL